MVRHPTGLMIAVGTERPPVLERLGVNTKDEER